MLSPPDLASGMEKCQINRSEICRVDFGPSQFKWPHRVHRRRHGDWQDDADAVLTGPEGRGTQ